MATHNSIRVRNLHIYAIYTCTSGCFQKHCITESVDDVCVYGSILYIRDVMFDDAPHDICIHL